LRRLGRTKLQMAPRQALETSRIIERRPFGAQRRDRVALAPDIDPHLGDALGTERGLEFDLVDVGRGRDQQDENAEVQDAHAQRPLITSSRDGKRGRYSSASKARGGAAVRSAPRSFAERARGLAATSASSATTGRLVSNAKVGGSAS